MASHQFGDRDARRRCALERRPKRRRLCDSKPHPKADPNEDLAPFEDASPIHHVREDAPPFFVIHGTTDNLAPVAQARRFVETLRQVSDEPVLYAELPGASHAFDVFYSTRTGTAIRAVDRFLAWIVDRERPDTPDRAPEDVGLAPAMEPVPGPRVEAP